MGVANRATMALKICTKGAGMLFPVGGGVMLNPKNSNTMSLVRYNSLVNDFVPNSFSNLIDRFFNDSIARTGGSSYSFVPRVDILEDEKAYEVHVAVPGMSKEDFKLDLNDSYLTVSGERKFNRERKEDNIQSLETQFGAFSRSFNLPENVDASKISARYTNGILEITIPKDEKRTLKTSIKVS